ncbi:Protein TIFY 4B-like isoform X1, variant 2 [Ancistrocladus abbreviatus]
MDGGVTTSGRSVLDKPLHELTEDDISQLTREDCRQYLKEKGMRRPSWNKSQAIQQVISLKSLLEPAPSPASTAPPPPPKAPLPPPPQNSPPVTSNTATSNSCSSLKELSRNDADASVSASADDGGPNRTKCPEPLKELEPVVDKKTVSPRSTDAIDLPVGQMTIFYSGKVNVYDGVPADRVQAIMHLAASPIQLSLDETTSGCAARWAMPSHLSPSSAKVNVIPPHAPISQPLIKGKMTEHTQQSRQEGNVLHEPDVEGQTNRQVSLQRYLEKRNRGRFKNKKKMGSSSGLEMYVNHQIKTQGLNGQSSRSSTSSPTQPGQPHALPVMENQSKNLGLSIDLNDKAGGVAPRSGLLWWRSMGSLFPPLYKQQV